jgi:glutamate racemase
MDKRPLGVFDSGLGGLSVVKEIIRVLPKEDVIYLGDTARIPYGTRSKGVVTQFAKEDTEFLIKRNVKCIIIACNTASAFAYKSLKCKYDIPIFDVITPAVSSALKRTKKKIIGVIGTRGTINSKAYDHELKKQERVVKICSKACPLFVPLIEEGEIKGDIIKAVIGKYLSFFIKKPIDTLILGCTHYPIIKDEIERFLGKEIVYIDPGREIAIALKDYLRMSNLLNNKKKSGVVSYYVTDKNKKFKETADMFMGKSISLKIKKVSI